MNDTTQTTTVSDLLDTIKDQLAWEREGIEMFAGNDERRRDAEQRVRALNSLLGHIRDTHRDLTV